MEAALVIAQTCPFLKIGGTLAISRLPEKLGSEHNIL